MVLPAVAQHEIKTLACDATSIIYDLPHGLIDLSNEAGERAIKPVSILECKYAALDRISLSENPKLLAGLSAAKQAALKTATVAKFALTAELRAFSETLDPRDDISKMKPDLIEMVKTLDRAKAPVIVARLKNMLAKPEAELKEEHAANGAHESFEKHIENLNRIIFQIERFLSTGRGENVYEDIFSRSIAMQTDILKKHILPLGADAFEEKKKRLIESAVAAGQKPTLDLLANAENLALDHILFAKMGMKVTKKFAKPAAETSEPVAGLKALMAGGGVEASAIGALLAALGVEEETPDTLVQFLKDNGPFAAQGFYGKGRYLEEAAIYKSRPEIGGRPVMCWKPGAKKEENLSVGHSVTIIGAQSLANGKGLVYFVDPTEPSDPADITQEKVYAISFLNFIQSNMNSVYTQGAGIKLRA